MGSFYIILTLLTILAFIINHYREQITQFYIKNTYGLRRRIKNINIKNTRDKRNALSTLSKTSRIVLTNNYNYNDYLNNDEHQNYIKKFKIRYYKAQLRTLKNDILQYVKFTNGRISVEHVIMLQEIKEKLKENGYKFNHKEIVTATNEQLNFIRNKQIKDEKFNTINLLVSKRIAVINDDLKKSYKDYYIQKHCLNNQLEIA